MERIVSSVNKEVRSSAVEMRTRRTWTSTWMKATNRLMSSSVTATVALLCCLSLLTSSVAGVELTFELPDNAKECFHEHIPKDKSSTFEFQVVTGGHYDVDVSIEAPNKQIIYKEVKKQYDTFTWNPEHEGVYTFCFSNEFSTFSHKLIYMDLQVGDESPLPGLGEHATALTQLESSAQQIHENLNSVLDYQTHHRLREAQSRKRAEDLNERVLLWSICETVAVLIIAVGQVVVLRNFFSEKRTSEIRNPLFAKH